MDALVAKLSGIVTVIGRLVMLAEAIILDRCLGTTPAATVIESLGGWQGRPQAIPSLKARIRRIVAAQGSGSDQGVRQGCRPRVLDPDQ